MFLAAQHPAPQNLLGSFVVPQNLAQRQGRFAGPCPATGLAKPCSRTSFLRKNACSANSAAQLRRTQRRRTGSPGLLRKTLLAALLLRRNAVPPVPGLAFFSRPINFPYFIERAKSYVIM
ncbi:hypothetical protein [Caldibacillus debilis]|uniref:hypothetical protein n=1 Tax=Caldibacillus debilis TaxID=301148 RepID=UPI0011C3D61B|nr:hypothetical protein [Caldibacillus debilis]